ncbi:hypothetical protein ES708_19333 [subsurface metagenome]
MPEDLQFFHGHEVDKADHIPLEAFGGESQQTLFADAQVALEKMERLHLRRPLSLDDQLALPPPQGLPVNAGRPVPG